MKKKIYRRKPTTVDLDNRIKIQVKKKIGYLIPSKEDIEFLRPKEDFSNILLSRETPTGHITPEGRFSFNNNHPWGIIKYFYLHKEEYKQLQKLFNAFVIPTHIQENLTWAYLNMAIAANSTAVSDKTRNKMVNHRKKFIQMIELLEDILNNKKTLKAITLKYKGLNEEKTITETLTWTDGNVKIIEEVLKKFKNIKNYNIYKSTYKHDKKYGYLTESKGYKNNRTQKQSDYAYAIFKYLSEYTLTHKQIHDTIIKKNTIEIKKIKRIYSKRRRYLFIGKLMMLAGLLPIKPNTSDKKIIDAIEKKIN